MDLVVVNSSSHEPESPQATTPHMPGLVDASTNQKPNEHPTTGASPEVRCEIKEYEEIYSGNERVLRERHEKVKKAQPMFAGKYTKFFDHAGTLTKVELEVRSPHIQKALRLVVKNFPGQQLHGEVLFLSGDRESAALGRLFHHLKDLEQFGDQQGEGESKTHIFLVVNLLKKEFRHSTQRFNAQAVLSENPSIEFRDLWMIFTPGDLIVAGTGFSEAAHEVVEAKYRTEYSFFGVSNTTWNITAKTFSYDGESFGYFYKKYTIQQYNGARGISELQVYPLRYHPDEEQLRARLLERGKMLVSLQGVQFRSYAGQATSVSYDKEADMLGNVHVSHTEEAIEISGRIIIDALAFAQSLQGGGISFQSQNLLKAEDVTEHDLLLGNSQVLGFSLTEKKWCRFMLDCIEDVNFDEAAFDALILPGKQKCLIRALAAQHTRHEDKFDDIITEKGKGCIFLLYGPPGVGKTATAESVADTTKQPLFVLTPSDLGSSPELIEAKLTSVFKLTARWHAILLVDEADVFLERRSSHDLSLNSLVPIFLRLLEYYRGVLFLTTNRIDNIDVAFRSRIHLAVSFAPLDSAAREKIWKLFLQRTANYDEKDWPDQVIQRPAEMELNGRQIKNVIRTANTLALAEKKKISMQEVQDVLDTVMEFQRHG